MKSQRTARSSSILPIRFRTSRCMHQRSFAGKSKAGKFGDAVEEIDWSVGEIIKKLRELNIEQNTLIFFTSDNGPWYEGSPGVYRGRKGQSYEGGFRVPFIAKWPGHIRPGQVSSEPAVNLDIFPTLLTLAGIEHPSDRIIDGKNIEGLLSGRDPRLAARHCLFLSL